MRTKFDINVFIVYSKSIDWLTVNRIVLVRTRRSLEMFWNKFDSQLSQGAVLMGKRKKIILWLWFSLLAINPDIWDIHCTFNSMYIILKNIKMMNYQVFWDMIGEWITVWSPCAISLGAIHRYWSSTVAVTGTLAAYIIGFCCCFSYCV